MSDEEQIELNLGLNDTMNNPGSRKQCWVCFASEEDCPSAVWVSPCKCKGTTKWVHHSCLQRWIDEKQHGKVTLPVRCPQCNIQYIITLPSMGPLVALLDLSDHFIQHSSPFLAAGILVGSVYWVAVTYGAVTVLQFAGYTRGLACLERADPLFLLLALPVIPLALILGRMLRWELTLFQALAPYTHTASVVTSASVTTSQSTATASETSQHDARLDTQHVLATVLGAHYSASRVLCSALTLPTVATVVGRGLFPQHSHMRASVYGTALVVLTSASLRLYYWHCKLRRHCRRQISDYIVSESLDGSTSEYEMAPHEY